MSCCGSWVPQESLQRLFFEVNIAKIGAVGVSRTGQGKHLTDAKTMASQVLRHCGPPDVFRLAASRPAFTVNTITWRNEAVRQKLPTPITISKQGQSNSKRAYLAQFAASFTMGSNLPCRYIGFRNCLQSSPRLVLAFVANHVFSTTRCRRCGKVSWQYLEVCLQRMLNIVPVRSSLKSSKSCDHSTRKRANT